METRLAEIAALRSSNVATLEINYLALLKTNLTAAETGTIHVALTKLYANAPVKERDHARSVASADRALTCPLDDKKTWEVLLMKEGSLAGISGVRKVCETGSLSESEIFHKDEVGVCC